MAVRAPMKRSVHEPIREKRQWRTPPDPETGKLGFRGWHSRGYLPHFDVPGIRQMLNYRLEDAMPASRRHEWAAMLEIKDDLQWRATIEQYLDSGFGNCELRDPRAAKVVEENWLHFDGEDYRLLAWVVMPNHVHLLVEIWQTPQTNCSRIGKVTARDASIGCSVVAANCGRTIIGIVTFAMRSIFAKWSITSNGIR